MTSPLDDISYKLGELSAGQAMLLARAEKRDVEMREFRTLLGEIKTRMKPLIEDVAFIKPQAKHYAGVRSRAAWLNSLVVGVASISGGAITTWLFKHFGG